MPCVYEWERHCVVKRFSGFVSAAEFVVSAETVGADPRFDELRLIINDLSSIEGHAIDGRAYLRVAASRIGSMQTNANYRVAFVARHADVPGLAAALEYGFQNLPFDPVLVETEAQARDWSGQAQDLDNPTTRF